MAKSVVTVEVVEHKTQMRRFTDLPYLLYRDDERWVPGVRMYEQWRLDERRHPYFEQGYAAYFLARRNGQPAGRVVAHLARSGVADGAFGFLDAPDDVAVIGALIDEARSWLASEGATSMHGPLSWTADEGFGVVVRGADQPGVTGRGWQPAHYAGHLAAVGLAPGEVRRTYRLDLADFGWAEGPASGPGRGADPPPHAGRYVDHDLILEGIAAVPDVSRVLRRASVRSAWRTARALRERTFDTAVCVRCDGDPVDLVPQLAAVARAAGYRWLIAPWAPPGREPETEHQLFHASWE